MLDRYTLDEFTPEERVRILLDSGSHFEKSELNFLVYEVPSHEERKSLANRILERTDISLSQGARKLLDGYSGSRVTTTIKRCADKAALLDMSIYCPLGQFLNAKIIFLKKFDKNEFFR